MKRKRKSNNPEGRPSHGLSETTTLVRGPELLFLATRHDAETQGVTLAEWIRRAMRVRLGWHEVVDGSVCNHSRRETVDGVQSCLGCGAETTP